MAYNQQLFDETERCKFPDVISNSIITDYKACPLKAFYSGIFRIRPLLTNPHLNSGKAFAVGLDAFRQAYYGTDNSFETAREAGFVALVKSYGLYEPPEKNINKTWNRMASAYFYYLRVYHPKRDSLRPAIINNKIATEFSFALPLDDNLLHPDTGDPILYTGRFDSIMEMGSPQNLFGYDDKTTSQLGATWPDQWGLRSQFIGYDWGAKQYGINLNGTIIRGISLLKTKHDHAQAIIFFSRWLRARWLESTIYTVKRMVQDYKTKYWDSNLGDSCVAYGGCEFKPLCESPEPHVWIPTYYEFNRWNPLKGEDDPLEEASDGVQ